MTEQRRFVVGTEIRAEKSGGQMKIVARALTYNKLSKRDVPTKGCYERIAPGCFTRSLANRDEIMCLQNHDPNFPLARTKNNSLRLMDTKDALLFEAQLDPSVSFHRDAHAMVESGLCNECSFAFGEVEDAWTEEKDERGMRCGVRTLRRAKLYDVSLVVTPAYPGTSAQARSLAYEFKPEANEDAELALRVAHLGELVRADRESERRAASDDVENILKLERQGRIIRSDELREEFEALKKELQRCRLCDSL